MPSQNQGGSRRDRRRFDDDLADDAARWLDWDLMSDSDQRSMVETLIKSIDQTERLRAWVAVERRLAALDDREPRAKIMQWLDQREEWLHLHGDRDDRLQERNKERDLPPVETTYPDRDDVDEADDRATFSAERAFGPLRKRYPHLFDEDGSTAESGETSAVAADGGDER